MIVLGLLTIVSAFFIIEASNCHGDVHREQPVAPWRWKGWRTAEDKTALHTGE